MFNKFFGTSSTSNHSSNSSNVNSNTGSRPPSITSPTPSSSSSSEKVAGKDEMPSVRSQELNLKAESITPTLPGTYKSETASSTPSITSFSGFKKDLKLFTKPKYAISSSDSSTKKKTFNVEATDPLILERDNKIESLTKQLLEKDLQISVLEKELDNMRIILKKLTVNDVWSSIGDFDNTRAPSQMIEILANRSERPKKIQKTADERRYLLDVINDVDQFRILDETQKNEMIDYMKSVTFQSGEILLKENKLCVHAIILQEGELEVVKNEIVRAKLLIRQFYEENSFFYRTHLPASVRAASAGVLWSLQYHHYQYVIYRKAYKKLVDNINLLKTISHFETIPSDALISLVRLANEVRKSPKEVIFMAGEYQNTMYIVKEGYVELLSRRKNESSVTKMIGVSSVFGEGVLVGDDKRTTTATAGKDGCLLLCLDRLNLQPYLNLLLITESNPVVPSSSDACHTESSSLSSPNWGEGGVLITREGSSHSASEKSTYRTPGEYHESSSSTSIGSGSRQHIRSSSMGSQCYSLSLQHPSQQKVSSPHHSSSDRQIAPNDLKTIGNLGYGELSLIEIVCLKTSPNVVYALKQMVKHEVTKNKRQNSVMNEVNILRELDSRFIIKLYHTMKNSKYLYFLLELCTGGDLEYYVSISKALPTTTVQFISGCIVEAISYIHSKNIIHRDIKTSNVVIHDSGYCKLIDFGNAIRVPPGRKVSGQCETSQYSAPELILNAGHDNSCDFWSLGIVIFVLLTGKHPFPNELPKKTSNLILNGISLKNFHEVRTPTSDAARNLIMKLCAKKDRLSDGHHVRKQKFYEGFAWQDLQSSILPSPLFPVTPDHRRWQSVNNKVRSFDTIPPDDLSTWDKDF